jgi:hypothetical protein
VVDAFGFDDVAFARQTSSLLLLFDEEEGEETTGVLESIVILFSLVSLSLKRKRETFACVFATLNYSVN